MMQKADKIVAFVCTGNTCRSPMAEAIFNTLAQGKNIAVRAESFGISTITGMRVSQNSIIVCGEIGIDLSAKTSISVVDADLKKYDAFFCMSNSHAQALLQLGVPASKIKVLGVPDPYGGDTQAYRLSRDTIYNSVKEIIKHYEDCKNAVRSP